MERRRRRAIERVTTRVDERGVERAGLSEWLSSVDTQGTSEPTGEFTGQPTSRSANEPPLRRTNP